jgi:hypothetical protein
VIPPLDHLDQFWHSGNEEVKTNCSWQLVTGKMDSDGVSWTAGAAVEVEPLYVLTRYTSTFPDVVNGAMGEVLG